MLSQVQQPTPATMNALQGRMGRDQSLPTITLQTNNIT